MEVFVDVIFFFRQDKRLTLLPVIETDFEKKSWLFILAFGFILKNK